MTVRLYRLVPPAATAARHVLAVDPDRVTDRDRRSATQVADLDRIRPDDLVHELPTLWAASVVPLTARIVVSVQGPLPLTLVTVICSVPIWIVSPTATAGCRPCS